jgi:hypothetical protein
MNAFSLTIPRTIKQALDELTTPKGGPGKLKAGGIDLLDLMKEGIEQPGRLINIRRLDEAPHALHEISEVKADAIPEGVWRLLPGSNDGSPPPVETVCALARWRRWRRLRRILCWPAKCPRSPSLRLTSQPRRFAKQRRWAAICYSDRAAGISDHRNISARKRAARSALPATEKTTSTPSSTIRSAAQFIHQEQRWH